MIKSAGLMMLDHLLCVYLTSQLKVVKADMLVHSTLNYHNCPLSCWLAILLTWVIWTSTPYHANFTNHTTSSSLPSPTQDSCTLTLAPQYLPTFSSLARSSPSKQQCKMVEASSTLYFWNHHTPIQSPGHCTCILRVAIGKPCAEVQGLQKPRITSDISGYKRELSTASSHSG